MKKILAALLSLMMILSVFAACGEKTSPAEDDNADTAQSPADAVSTPSSPDDEEADKDTTETVTETGEVTVTAPAGDTTPDSASPAPSSQAQTGAQTPPSSSGKTDTPSPAQTEPSKPSEPSSAQTPSKSLDDGKYKVHVFGDSVVNVHSPFDVFFGMAEKAGHPMSMNHNTVPTFGKSVTYNLYELYNFNGNDISSEKSKTFFDAITSPLDCLVILSSRDRSMMSNASPQKILTSFDDIQKKYYAANPNGKIVLLVPMPYLNTNGEHGEKFEIKGITPEEHSKRIKDFAAKTAALAKGKIIQLQIGDAFDYFNRYYASEGLPMYEDTGLYESIPGAYYMSCLLYAAIFDETPCGIDEYGFLDKDTATMIQGAAHKFFFGTEPPKSPAHKAAAPHDAYRERDPRTMSYRDPFYKNEKYPQYFDELLSTAYFYEAAGKAVQYDQYKISKIQGATLRTHQGMKPEELTPQRLAYLDCTWFVHSVFKSAFAYTIKESVSAKVIDITDGEVFRWVGPDPNIPAAEAVEEFKKSLQPGDVIMWFNREAGQGHGMLYLGNGIIIHCSSASHKAGGSADYDYTNKVDFKEPLGGVLYSHVGILYDNPNTTCFTSSNEVLILRPLSLGLKPTAEATARAKNLAGIICWKLSSATAGATVNPGDDVTFTYYLRNDNTTDKKVAITDKLPANTVFKSGDVKFENGALNTTVTVPARKSLNLSFTVTVSKDAPAGKITCGDTTIGGVKLADYCPIYVARTLTRDEQAKISAADVTAVTEKELISKTYDTIGKAVSLDTGKALITSVFDMSPDGLSIMISNNGKNRHLVVQNLYGGRSNPDTDPNRLRHIGIENFTCGDVLGIVTNSSTVQLFLYAGGGVFKTVEGKKVVTYNPGNSAILLDQLFAEYGFFVLRPSFDF